MANNETSNAEELRSGMLVDEGIDELQDLRDAIDSLEAGQSHAVYPQTQSC